MSSKALNLIGKEIAMYNILRGLTSDGPGPASSDLLPPHADTTKVVCERPRVVSSDYRYEGAPCFLYLPENRADTVFVDYLPHLHHVASWTTWKQDVLQQDHPLGFSMRHIPGKGMGLFAERQIGQGELIFAERPIWVGRNRLRCAADQTNANGIFYRAAVQGLSRRSQAVLLGLANSYPSTEYDVIPGILNTNCLEITLGGRNAQGQKDVASRDGADTYIGCFPTLSRANHSCSPNAHYVFSSTAFVGELRAARTIARGEEITITYTSLCVPRAQRRAFLAHTRFFQCACATCASPDDQVRVSDARRVRIHNLLQKMQEARFPPRISKAELEEAVKWAREEGMWGETAQLLLCGSQVLTVYDELSLAMDWANDARTLFRSIEGQGSENERKLDDADRVHQMMAAAPRPLNI